MFVTFHWSYGMPHALQVKTPITRFIIKIRRKEIKENQICICIACFFSKTEPKFELNQILFRWFSGKQTARVSVNGIGIVVWYFVVFIVGGIEEKLHKYRKLSTKATKAKNWLPFSVCYGFYTASIDMCAFILTLFRHYIIWYVSYWKVFEIRSATPMTGIIWSKLLYKSSGAVYSFVVFFAGNEHRWLGLCDWLRLLFLPSNWNAGSLRGKIAHFSRSIGCNLSFLRLY